MAMPPMMQDMMQKVMADMTDVNPMAMCRAMMTSVAKSAEMAAYATPEVRGLFEEWARSVEEEVEVALREGGPLDLDQIAARLKVSRESALYFVSRLVGAGKASISGVKASANSPAAG
jgi:hypothetical protein